MSFRNRKRSSRGNIDSRAGGTILKRLLRGRQKERGAGQGFRVSFAVQRGEQIAKDQGYKLEN